MATELRVIVDERALRVMGRAKRRAQEARADAAKRQREAQLEADQALVARNLALQLLKTEREREALAAAATTQPTTESEAETWAAIEQARARVAAEREAKAKREARLNLELMQAIKKRLAADRARGANKGVSGNAALRELANGVTRASASPKDKQRRVAVTPETVQQPRSSTRAALTFIDVVDAFRPERLSRRAEAIGEDGFLKELKQRREEKKRPAEEERGPAARTRARRATSTGAAPASASVNDLLGNLWTERASPTAQATF